MSGRVRSGRGIAGRRAVDVPKELSVRCPRCEAAKGWRCMRLTGLGEALKGTHQERQQAVREAKGAGR